MSNIERIREVLKFENFKLETKQHGSSKKDRQLYFNNLVAEYFKIWETKLDSLGYNVDGGEILAPFKYLYGANTILESSKKNQMIYLSPLMNV